METLNWRFRFISLVVLTAFPSVARAGMPTVTLSDMARMRVETISVFLVGYFLSAWCIQLL